MYFHPKRRPLFIFVLSSVFSLALGGCFLLGEDDSGAPGGPGVGDECTSNAECIVGATCAGGTCQVPGTVGFGGACWTTTDCVADLFCSAGGVCAPAGEGAEGSNCLTPAECEQGLVCRLYGFGGVCATPGDAELGAPCEGNLDCVAGLACNSIGMCEHPSEAFPPFVGVDCAADDDQNFRGFFEVPRATAVPADFFRLPFPNDARVRADGSVDLSDFPTPGQSSLGIDLVDLYVRALEDDFTGFAAQGVVSFRFSGAVDFDSLDPSKGGVAPVFVDITDPANPSFVATSFGYSGGRGLYQCQNILNVRGVRTRPLESGHTYAVFVTDMLRSAGGGGAAVEPDLAAVLGSARPTGDPAAENAWDRYVLFRDFLAQSGTYGTTDVAVATVFTVQDTVGFMGRLAAGVAAEPLPVLSDVTLCGSGVVSPCDDGDTRVCGAPNAAFDEIHGRISVPIYQQGVSPYEFVGGRIVEDASGPIMQGSQDVCFALTVPKSPAGDVPTVVFAHGTGGRFNGAVGSGVAEQLASRGIATLAYEGVVHGERANGSTIGADNLMFNVLNPPAAKYNNMQGGVDVLQMLRVPQVGVITVPNLGSVSLDPNEVYYFGHSQGSNVGIPAIAWATTTSGAVFSGAGAYLTQGILSKTSPVDAKAGLELLLGEPLSTSHPVMTIWQTYFESVDTANYGPLLYREPPQGVNAKNVFMSWGTGDTFSPVPTLNAMADSGTLAPVAPGIDAAANFAFAPVSRPISDNVQSADGSETVTAACFQYAPNGYDGHFVATRDPQAVADWGAFFSSLISTGTATVP